MSDFDSAYRDVSDLFGAEPHPLVERYCGQLPAGARVLDIGVGQGRNAFPLARRGFVVHGIDPSQVAVQAVSAVAEREQLPLSAECVDFSDHEPSGDGYDGVLVIGLIPILEWRAIDRLRVKLRAWTRAGSLVWLTAFTIDDPAYDRWASEGRRLGEHSFARDEVGLRTFLRPNQLLDLFADYQVIHHEEGLGPWHHHGDAPRERHAVAELVARR